MTWQECCRQAVGQLTEADIENASAESWFLMEASCEISRNFYYLHGNEVMPPEKEARFQEWVAARCKRIPLQHLTGEQEFMGLPFMVTPDVLIPRQDTEVLVELALEQLKLLLKQKQQSTVYHDKGSKEECHLNAANKKEIQLPTDISVQDEKSDCITDQT